MPLFLIIYLYGLIIIPIALLILNYHYKWLSKQDYVNDSANIFSLFLISIAVWPLIITVAIMFIMILPLIKGFKIILPG